MRGRGGIGISGILIGILLGAVSNSYALNIQWTPKTDMPTARNQPASVVYNSKVYVFAGMTGSGDSDAAEVYNPAVNSWTVLTSMPTAREYPGAGVVAGKMYVIGGFAGGVVSTVEEYDPVGNSWTAMAPMPTARVAPAAATVGGKIYVFGGYDIYNSATVFVEMFDPASNTWTTKASMPTARWGMATALVGGKIFAMGGDFGGGPPGLKTVEMYDPSGNAWAASNDLLTARSLFTAGVVGGKIYAIGGGDGFMSEFATVEEGVVVDTRAVLQTGISAVPNPAVVGAPLKLVLTVTNAGVGNANNVVPHLEVTSGLPSLFYASGPVPPGPVTLTPGSAQNFTWTYNVLLPGGMDFSGTATGIDAYSGLAESASDYLFMFAADKGNLVSSVTIGPSPAYIGQWVTVCQTVSNTGTATVDFVSPNLPVVAPGAGLVTMKTGPLPSGPVTLAPMSSTTFVWTYSASGSGVAQFNTSADGIDAVFGTLSTSANRSVSINRPARLTAQVIPAPATVSIGQWMQAIVVVANTGDAAATGVSATLFTGPRLDFVSGPAGTVTIPGGNYSAFTWTFSATANGSVGLTATATGIDSALLTTLTATATGSVLVKIPATLSATVHLSPGSVNQGDPLILSITVTNTGEAAASAVTPYAVWLPADSVAVVSGPVPAGPVTISGGASRTFIWTMKALKTYPAVVFSATAVGGDENSGRLTGDGGTCPAISISAAAYLKATVGVTNMPIKEGEEFLLSLNVTNPGDLPASSVGPSLVFSEAGLAEVLSGPSPSAGATLNAGGSMVFTWQMRTVKAGTLRLTASVTGKDGAGVRSFGDTATVSIEINPKFDEDLVLYPNPVSGNSFTLGIRLDNDAKEIDADIYDTAFRRIFSGRWMNVAKTDGVLVIDGVSRWAPGMYIVKVKIKSGSGQVTRLSGKRIVVKR